MFTRICTKLLYNVCLIKINVHLYLHKVTIQCLLNFTIKINVHLYLHKVTMLNFTIKINVHPYLHKVTIQRLLCVSSSIK